MTAHGALKISLSYIHTGMSVWFRIWFIRCRRNVFIFMVQGKTRKNNGAVVQKLYTMRKKIEKYSQACTAKVGRCEVHLFVIYIQLVRCALYKKFRTKDF